MIITNGNGCTDGSDCIAHFILIGWQTFGGVSFLKLHIYEVVLGLLTLSITLPCSLLWIVLFQINRTPKRIRTKRPGRETDEENWIQIINIWKNRITDDRPVFFVSKNDSVNYSHCIIISILISFADTLEKVEREASVLQILFERSCSALMPFE